MIKRFSVLAVALATLPAALPAKAQNTAAIPGYAYGDKRLAHSPVSAADFELLKKSVLFTEDDVKALHEAGEILVPQTDKILDVWYGFVGGNSHLAYYFADRKTGELDKNYLARVRARFGRWIADTTAANYDQTWLDWQHEIALRHATKKNKTDGANAAPIVNYRYMVAFIYPISATIRPFLAASGRSAADVDRMQAAWTKAITLQAILWTYPYIREGQF